MVKLEYLPSSLQLADIFTKPLPKSRLEFLRALLGLTADYAADEVPLAVDEGRPEDNATAAAEEANAQIPRNTSGALALTDKSLCPAPDFMQMDNTLVEPVDLLPRKLLILDVEGLLLYAESFMGKTSKTDCGDVISNGMKTVVRRNGVQAIMRRCLQLFDVALWSCCSRNTLWDYTHYLFSEHPLQGSQRPLHFRATSRGLPGLLHKFSAQAVETYVPPLLTKRKKLTDYEKDVLRRLPDIDELGDHDCVAWARLLGLSWNQSLEDDLTTIGLSDESRARHTSTKASVKYARDFLLEVKGVNFA
ncbi:hypothetical protein R1sor_013280 [Riccia sorocarpa]|uniref:FCP1 homology domain-containing protein n=1 Tax=Riccia sorocarpa TaxID=122646 RepID=A0ABD3H839_9MARC